MHTLAGSAGTFGLDELGQQAHEFEVKLKGLLSGAHWTPAEHHVFIAQLTAYLEASTQESYAAVLRGTGSVANVTANQSRLIYLVDKDRELTGDIGFQIEQFGCEVKIISGLRSLSRAIAERLPAAIVIDLEFIENLSEYEQDLKRVMQLYQHRFPFIYISKNTNFEKRLEAVRLGAAGYLTKPVDAVVLTDRLDALIKLDDIQPYRILIVDDNAITSDYYASVLRGDGMDVRLLHQPADVFNVLSQFRPELILMDAYMLACTGVELCKIIRQDKCYIDVPIVFLSGDADMSEQLDAIRAGADDFLSKPVEPAYLISALSGRALRYRSLRSLIMRDGLTGLFNHSAIKEKISSELSSTSRSNSTMALAVLDLDNFKRVNDAYGHPMGDQVLRTLSRLLQQRLRRSDIIGRYGGEEFVVIFPDTTASVASAVLDQIREAFSNIVHYSNLGEFKVTFSAGIADLSNGSRAEEVFAMADNALYQAKQNGRNCLKLA